VIAVARLLAGQVDASIGTLEQLAAADPTRIDVVADLATAKFERSVRSERSRDAADAFSLATQTLRHDSLHLQALQVRALALESLCLRADATEAWNEYLRADSGSPWAVEAREHVRSLSVADDDAEASLTRAIESNDRAGVDRAVARWPQNARTRVEENLLGEWGDAVAAGDIARMHVHQARHGRHRQRVRDERAARIRRRRRLARRAIRRRRRGRRGARRRRDQQGVAG